MATNDSQPRAEANKNSEAKDQTDPFAAQRETGQPTITIDAGPEPVAGVAKENVSPSKDDRRQSSDEWDASKTPPSRFQQRKGSLYATPGSRDGHVDKNYDRDAAYHAKLAEKGWSLGGKKRRGSKAGSEEGK
ncbi:hypothetical protein BGZ57DRAFT_924214 [Hyaloscypha finlandica]|nr:hypothetical protein BGZ57DRAFT_924214 [Hyaloscypha finlandica]